MPSKTLKFSASDILFCTPLIWSDVLKLIPSICKIFTQYSEISYKYITALIINRKLYFMLYFMIYMDMWKSWKALLKIIRFLGIFFLVGRIDCEYKIRECMVINKRDLPRCELQIGIVKIKPVQQFNYLGSALTNNRNQRAYWNSKRCHPENKQSMKKLETVM